MGTQNSGMDQVPDEILSLLNSLKNGVLKCLKSRVKAIYVYGSLTMDDFVPESSDIDFMVIVTELPGDAACLRKLHERLASTTYGSILDGDYVPLSHLSPKGGLRSHYGYSGTFTCHVPGDMISPDTLRAITQKSIVLYGPPPKDIIPGVEERDLKEYMVDILYEYREEFRNSDEPPSVLASEVLNMLRSYYAVVTGQVISKSEAASAALASLPDEWHPVIKAAVQMRHGKESEDTTSVLKENTGGLAEFLAELVGQVSY
jgi:predicted nucleotidyltransferase